MQKRQLTIQFASIAKLWEFKKTIQLNTLYIDIAKSTLTFKCADQEKIGWAIEQYHGQIVNHMERV
jgi:hypothetical protein